MKLITALATVAILAGCADIDGDGSREFDTSWLTGGNALAAQVIVAELTAVSVQVGGDATLLSDEVRDNATFLCHRGINLDRIDPTVQRFPTEARTFCKLLGVE